MDKFIIVGCPNTGKTTLFNNLTKSREKTANYSGVTVKEKSKVIKYKNKEIEVVDLPGLYSLHNLTSEDELSAKKYLEEHKEDNIIFLCSSSSITKNFVLLSDLINNGFSNIKIVINKTDNGFSEEVIKKAKEKLNVPFVQVDARKNREQILDYLVSAGASYINSTLKLDEILKLFPTSIESLKRIDKVLFHPLLGKLIFIAVLGLLIFISYGPMGNGITNKIEGLIDPYLFKISAYLKFKNMVVIAGFFDSVIVGGVVGVLVYLPQLALMLTFIYMLEDSGYLPRVASCFNNLLKKCGMDGKSVFSLVMGVGCTTSAVLCTRNIDDKKTRVNTMIFLPFIGCSAKLPIFMLIASMITKGRGVLIVFLIYLISLVLGLLCLRLFGKDVKETSFIVEIPKLKAPSLKMSIKHAVTITIELFKRVVVSVLILASIIWLLSEIGTDFKFNTANISLLYWLVDRIKIVFYPIGITSTNLIVSLISGIVAKENILSIIGVLGKLDITIIQGVSFLIFVMLYSPCVATIKCTASEFGLKEALVMFLRSCVIAYISSFIFYTFALINLVLGVVAVVVLNLLLVLTIKTFVKTSTCYNCNKCKKAT